MIPKFASIDEFMGFFDKEIKDKSRLYAMKKAAYKTADAVGFRLPVVKEDAVKGFAVMNAPDTMLRVKTVINTTNILDSHGDVHMKGLWNKSLQERRVIYHLQEHQMAFDKVISDNVKASTERVSWKDLGLDAKGYTEALVFDSLIEKERNEFMYQQYAKGYVQNHSVGMQYVKIAFCVDSKDKYWAEEKENFDKYIDEVVNKDEAIEAGSFWAVLEAKAIEGSAVLIGSNTITPTMSVTTEAAFSTSDEPNKITQVDISKLLGARLINF